LGAVGGWLGGWVGGWLVAVIAAAADGLICRGGQKWNKNGFGFL